MTAVATALMFINPAHTGGRDLPSDIVLPHDLLEPLCHAVNDDLFGCDIEFFDEDDEELEFDEDDLAALWVWRKPRLRKA